MNWISDGLVLEVVTGEVLDAGSDEYFDIQLLGFDDEIELGGFRGKSELCCKFILRLEFKALSVFANPNRHSCCELQFFVEPPFLSWRVASSLCPLFLLLHSDDLWLQRPCVQQ